VLVSDAALARRVVQEAGFHVRARDVLIRNMKVVDQPGSWGRLARRLADADVLIEFHYFASDGRIVVGVDDYEKAVHAVQVRGG